MSRRVYLIGTNTEIGKTAVLEAVLQRAKTQSISAIPFKPAQSGSMPDPESDAGRLIAAADYPQLELNSIAPHRYPEDKAPGVIASPDHFLESGHAPDLNPIQVAEHALNQLENRYQPNWSFCEGAGGLHVPMPGGTWQSQWITTLAQACIIVAPTGLGTINHTLLTAQALEGLHLPILGIAWTGVQAGDKNLAEENMRIVEVQTKLPALSRPDQQGGLTLVDDFFQMLEHRHPTTQLTIDA